MNFNDTYKNKRVLITGHTGFKGSWLCEWLLKMGADVYGLALEPNTEPDLFTQLGLVDRIDHRIGDIRDLKTVVDRVLEVKPDFLFHLAAQPLVRLSYRQPVETFNTNIMGTVHVLEALRRYSQQLSTNNDQRSTINHCAAVMITTDKCYQNKEWLHAYREEDPMGGHDPYSASKGACELVIQSYRDSFFSPTTNNQQPTTIAVASARAGNVIGGGDWALDRIVPDCVRALVKGESIPVRNRISTRPWQHVLEPLGGYLLLASRLHQQLTTNNQQLTTNNQQPTTNNLCSAFNFGPPLHSNRTVQAVVEEILKHWPGEWTDCSDPNAPHEAGKLNLATDKAFHTLGWSPRWNFETTVARTINWYKAAHEGRDARSLVDADLEAYCG